MDSMGMKELPKLAEYRRIKRKLKEEKKVKRVKSLRYCKENKGQLTVLHSFQLWQ